MDVLPLNSKGYRFGPHYLPPFLHLIKAFECWQVTGMNAQLITDLFIIATVWMLWVYTLDSKWFLLGYELCSKQSDFFCMTHTHKKLFFLFFRYVNFLLSIYSRDNRETLPIAYATYIFVKYKVHVVQYVDFSAS